MPTVNFQLRKVHDALSAAGRFLTPKQYLDLLEELQADIDGQLEELKNKGGE